MFRLRALRLHPTVEQRLLELPAVAQLKGRNPLLVDVLVKRISGHSQVVGRFPDAHDFSGFSHAINPATRIHSPMVSKDEQLN
jgi:hypothetical protein